MVHIILMKYSNASSSYSATDGLADGGGGEFHYLPPGPSERREIITEHTEGTSTFTSVLIWTFYKPSYICTQTWGQFHFVNSNSNSTQFHLVNSISNSTSNLSIPIPTRESEMANISPRHMPVLGNVHPIKIENFDMFSWRHFSARSSFYIFNWSATQEVPSKNILKEIVGPVFF